jgi:hypothetical protein
MDPVTRLAVPGLAGGLVVAFILIRLNRRSVSHVALAPPTRDQLSTDMINMAHIRVVGIGGLGLVAMCAMVAAYIPTVGLSLAAGFALGTLLAAVLILRRKKSGPMPSSSQRPGANTVLSIDAPAPMPAARGPRRRDLHQFAAGAARG